MKDIFKKEITDGDALHIASEVIEYGNNQITTLHNITSNDGKPLTKLQFIWKKK